TKIEHRDNDDGEYRSCHRAEQRHKFFSGTRFEWPPDHRPHLLSITWVVPEEFSDMLIPIRRARADFHKKSRSGMTPRGLVNDCRFPSSAAAYTAQRFPARTKKSPAG